MISHIRRQYNGSFSQEKYRAFLQTLERAYGEAPNFRVAETPVFIPADLTAKFEEACIAINDFLSSHQFDNIAHRAISLPDQLVPNEDQHSLFLQYDFGIARNEAGELVPQLIELQGFPSLYFYQHLLAQSFRRHFDIPAHMSHLAAKLDFYSYIELLRKVIVGDHNPKNVILLEIEPEKQVTRIDFWGAEQMLGIKVLCLSKLQRDGRNLYYLDDKGNKVAVHRIFNRVIFDELVLRQDLPRTFDFTQEVDVEWAGHPNWFMKISKYNMPYLDNPFVPKTYFLSDLEEYPEDLENYVLKPLFSFSGKGVLVDVTKADLDAVKDRSNFILQRKIEFSPVIETLDPAKPAKCEIRLMMIWEQDAELPVLASNLVRMTKGKMAGARYNQNEEWVGATVGFFEHP